MTVQFLAVARRCRSTSPNGAAARLSPKASLAWRPGEGWRVTLSAGQAYRFPTVSELYQAVASGPAIFVPDPDLRPERARSAELAVERSFANGRVRLSLFNERIRDALISQTSPAPGAASSRTSRRCAPAASKLVFDWRTRSRRARSVGQPDPGRPRDRRRDPAFPAAEGKDIPQVPRRRATLVATYHAGERASLHPRRAATPAARSGRSTIRTSSPTPIRASTAIWCSTPARRFG